MLLNIVATFAFDTNSVFGIKKQDSADGYQQYVGKSFIVRPAYGPLETWGKSGFMYNTTYDGSIYTIIKVKVKDVKLNKKPNKRITIVAENAEKGIIAFKGYEEVSEKIGYWGNIIRWPLIEYMPIVFTEPFNEYKQKLIGKTITHEMVKDEYEIIDAFIGKESNETNAKAETNVIVKNKRTGETVTCPYSKVESEPFRSALRGLYKTALIRVEKPEDTTNRYGETKIVQDKDIDKFSYNDSIIDIIIYNTRTNFEFVLKNISDHSLKIIWNEAVYVGLDGVSSKIMHVGTKYADRESDQPVSVVIKGAKINDCATPTANVFWNNNSWETRNILPNAYIGKEPGEIRLMLPIQVKEVVNEYTFVFKVYYTYTYPELLHADKL